MLIGGHGAVSDLIAPVLLTVIDEAAPDKLAAMGLQGAGEHIRTLGVVTAIGEGAGPMLTVCLDEEASQIGDGRINHLALLIPPGLHALIQRIGGVDAMAHGLRVVNGDHQLHTEGAEDRCDFGQLWQPILNEPVRGVADIDVVDAQHVQAHGGHQAGEAA